MADGMPYIEITKEQFKDAYFRHGCGAAGWTAEYWQQFFETDCEPGWKFLLQAPSSTRHNRMWIGVNHEKKEYRVFFLTEDATEAVFDYPGKD